MPLARLWFRNFALVFLMGSELRPVNLNAFGLFVTCGCHPMDGLKKYSAFLPPRALKRPTAFRPPRPFLPQYYVPQRRTRSLNTASGGGGGGGDRRGGRRRQRGGSAGWRDDRMSGVICHTLDHTQATVSTAATAHWPARLMRPLPALFGTAHVYGRAQRGFILGQD